MPIKNINNAMNDLKSAIEDYSKTIEIDPNNLNAYLNRGNSKYKLKDYEGAIEDYNKAIEINPDNSIAYYIRGNSKHHLKNFDGAISDYSKAIEINPDYSDIYYNRGFLKGALKDNEGAIEDFSKAIELNPKYLQAYQNRGKLKIKINDYKGALIDYLKAQEIDPDSLIVLVYLGFVKSILKDYNGSISDYSRAIEINNDNSFLYFLRGKVNFDIGEINCAISDFGISINLNPENYEAYLYRGNARWAKRDHEGALFDYNDAIQNNPDCSYAYLNRGFLKNELKDHTAAFNDVIKGFELNENLDLLNSKERRFIVDQTKKMGRDLYDLMNYDASVKIYSKVSDFLPIQDKHNYLKAKLKLNDKKFDNEENNSIYIELDNLMRIYRSKRNSNELLSKDEENIEKLIQYNSSSILNFGKYTGRKLSEIIELDADYILWCIINLKHFSIIQELLLNPKFENLPIFYKALKYNLCKEKIIYNWREIKNFSSFSSSNSDDYELNDVYYSDFDENCYCPRCMENPCMCSDPF